MKGLVLSGGHGVRLRPLTFSQQKQLIPVANKPILFYCIEDLIGSGIHSIGIIVGPNRDQVVDTVNSVPWDAEIEFIYQDSPAGLAHAVKIAEPFLGDERFIMYLGDNLLKGGIRGFVDDFTRSDVAASLLLTRVEHPEQYGVALVDEQKKVILQLLEKPRNPPSNLSIVGIYGMTPRIHEAIRHIEPSWRGELEITDALHWLIKQGLPVRYRMVEGWWKDTGRPEDILEANHLILDELEPENAGRVTESTISGRVRIGKGTVISNRSVVKGPAIIGRDCTISGAYIGPYSAIGDKAQVVDTEVEDSIVMEGTRIERGGRIVESLIGRDVTITRDGRLPEGSRLVVGDNSKVHL